MIVFFFLSMSFSPFLAFQDSRTREMEGGEFLTTLDILRRLSAIFVFVLFAMQYKVCLGCTKRYHFFGGGGGCVKAIPRTALLLSNVKNAILFHVIILRSIIHRGSQSGYC
jgi:hypothetical protein